MCHAVIPCTPDRLTSALTLLDACNSMRGVEGLGPGWNSPLGPGLGQFLWVATPIPRGSNCSHGPGAVADWPICPCAINSMWKKHINCDRFVVSAELICHVECVHLLEKSVCQVNHTPTERCCPSTDKNKEVGHHTCTIPHTREGTSSDRPRQDPYAKLCTDLTPRIGLINLMAHGTVGLAPSRHSQFDHLCMHVQTKHMLRVVGHWSVMHY